MNSARDTQVRVVSKNKNGSSPHGFKWFVVLLLLLGALLIDHTYSSDKKIVPGLIETTEGNLTLSPKRQAKLDRELEEIDNAIQYALVATLDGNYPCLFCPFGLKTIFLSKGNVWKYGITRKTESERYPGGNYGAPDLLFIPMFSDTYSGCLKQEKILNSN